MTLRLRDLLDGSGEALQLECLTGELGLERPLPDAEVASPGLALAGFTARFIPNRTHVFGETEITYLNSLSADDRQRTLTNFFGFDLPCIFVTKGQEVPVELLELARTRGVPVFRSKLKTAEFYRRIKPIVEEAFAPRTTLHGSLADVYGDGRLDVLALQQAGSVKLLRNESAPSGWTDLGHGLAGSDGVPSLLGVGEMQAGAPGALKLTHANPDKLAALFVGPSSAPTPFKGGMLVPVPPSLVVMLRTSAAGTIRYDR